MASRSFVSSEARQECAGREDAGCSETLHLPSSLSRARPDFLPTILAMVWGLTGCFDSGPEQLQQSAARVQWRMLGKLGKDCMGEIFKDRRDDGDDASGRWLGSRANCSRAAAIMLLGDNSALPTWWMGARAMSRRRGSFCGR